MRLSIPLALALTIALLTAAPASAGSVCLNNGVATFVAADVTPPGACSGAPAASEVNALTVSTNAAGDIVFSDTNPITDADGPGGCSASGNTASCPGALAYLFDLGGGADSATVAAVAAAGISTGGDGDDILTGGPLDDNLDGGPGNDKIDGGAGDDTLIGGDGADVLNGGSGRDTLVGGFGDDALNGGDDDDTLDGGATPGCFGSGGDDILNGDGGDDALCGGAGPAAGVTDNDSLNGGDGDDTAYYRRAVLVHVSLDNVATDGQAGEADNVHSDVENLTGGAGDDVLTGSDGRNVLDGGPGADVLLGLGGNDILADTGNDVAANRLDGGGDDDTLSAGRGPDVFIGGDGEDTVTYATRTTAVTVTLDDNADDGAAGEGDKVGPDVEDVVGGSGSDTLIGNAADNELSGGPGDDLIMGGDGNDGLSGGPGRDTLDGGSGRDSLSGGAGADLLKTRDGVTDRAECGGGTDSVQGEARDDISGDCENVDIAAPTAVTIASVVVTRSGFVVVRVACPGVERSCSGAIIVKTVRRVAKRFIRLGQVNYRLRGGDSRALRARISATDRKPLKRAKRVKVRTVVTNANSDTGTSTSATRLTIVTTRGL